uniref:hypothetical protein n=1 Tax=Microtetraspora niveoalba TaxID=46175 RepID=UPI0012F73E23|nr:hypothetical protein [Microtetraspora niveoalba]
MTLAMSPAACSANHRLSSGPAVMPQGNAPDVGSAYSLIVPDVVIRPILSVFDSVNHRAPSEPTATWAGWASVVGTEYSVNAPPVVTRPILSA